MHRERAAHAGSSVGRDNRRPRAGAHLAVSAFDNPTLDADPKIGVERIERGPRPRDCTTNRFFIAEWLICHLRRHGDTFDADFRQHQLHHRPSRGDLYRIRRTDGDESNHTERGGASV